MERHLPSSLLCSGLVYGAVILSGMAALGHQTVWVRATIDILGANADTFSKVVGAFFLGLAGGAWIAVRHAARSRPWLWVAGAECLVILLALPVIFCHRLAPALHESTLPGALAPWVLPLLLIAPPAVAMGVFLPWTIHALAWEGRPGRTRSVLLYAVNTIGGIAGIGLVLLWLFPRLGLVGTALLVLIVNAAVAGFVLIRHQLSAGKIHPGDRIISSTSNTIRPSEDSGKAESPPRFDLFLAFFSGFLVLAAEVVYKHQFAQISINSLYSASVVLAVVLTALAAAPLALPLLLRKFRPGVLLAWTLIASGLLFAAQPLVFMTAGPGLDMLPYGTPFGRYSLDLFVTGLIYAGPALFAAGLLFPILLYRAVSRSEENAGRAAAQLFLWNGLGGWTGAEAVNLFFGPALGLWLTMTALGGVYLVLAWVAVNYAGEISTRRGRATRYAVAGFSAAVLIGAFPVARLPMVSPSFGKPIEVRLGKEGVIAVVESSPGERRLVMNNTYVLGGTRAWAHQERQAHLPLLLHGNPRSVGFIGIATGGSVAGAAMHPSVQSIEAIEISSLVIRFAENHFADLNRRLFDDPRLTAIHDDARWVVSRRMNAYDVVVGDLFLPWRSGTGRLYTVEHFEAVQRALRPDGIFCQWLPLYQLTEEQFHLILETFRTVFPEMVLIRGDFFHEMPIVGLAGPFRLEEHDWSKSAGAAERLRLAFPSGDPLTRHTEGVAMMVLGEPPPATPSRPSLPNTLANARLELSAARGILGRRDPWFTGLRFADFCRETAGESAHHLNGTLADAHDSGLFVLELELANGAGLARATEMKSGLESRLPTALLNDEGANWRAWPGAARPNPGNWNNGVLE